MQKNNLGFGTRTIHAGNVKNEFNALATPIYQTSTFHFDECEQGGRRFTGEEEGMIYTRLGNPTTSVLENKIAELEGGEAAVATSSGMGAISSALWTIAAAGKHIITDNTLYGCTFAYFTHGLTRYGVDVSFIDTSNIDEVKEAFKENTVAVYLETPANPNLKISDIELIAKIAHEYNKDIKVVCDNTFATPFLQNPLKLGADVVVHSVTKYLNGHGDVIAGAVIGSKEFIQDVRTFGVKDMTGSVLGPQEAYLVLRGLKTLELRMLRHCESGKKIAEYLEGVNAVEKVYFPGLLTHDNHAVAKKQMKDFGGMISFEIKGGREAGIKFVNSLKLCTIAVSLGDAETLIEHPASMTHSTYSVEELEAGRIPEGLIRLSVGLENVEDIIKDLEQAFLKL